MRDSLFGVRTLGKMKKKSLVGLFVHSSHMITCGAFWRLRHLSIYLFIRLSVHPFIRLSV